MNQTLAVKTELPSLLTTHPEASAVGQIEEHAIDHVQTAGPCRKNAAGKGIDQAESVLVSTCDPHTTGKIPGTKDQADQPPAGVGDIFDALDAAGRFYHGPQTDICRYSLRT